MTSVRCIGFLMLAGKKRQFRISPYSEHRITLLSAQDNTTKILIADICHILLSTVEHVK